MAKNILHISDLHLEDFDAPEGKIKTRFQEPNFKAKFFKKIKESFERIDYILITGDLANQGTHVEYNLVLEFIKELQKQLKVEKENIFICPGNHDVNWNKSRTIYHKVAYEAGTKDAPIPNEKDSYIYHNEKFEDFTSFYNAFYENKFSFTPDQSIFRELDVDIDGATVKFCGINSCFRESHYKENHYGFINHSSLASSLEKLDEKVLKFALMHHIPIVLNNTKSIANWDEEIKFLCVNNNIRVFVFGHQHRSQSTTIIEGEQEFIEFSVGTLGKLDSDVENTFSVMTLSYDEEQKLLNITNHPFQYIKNSGDYKWLKIDENIEHKAISYELSRGKIIGTKDESKEIIPEILAKYTFPERLARFSTRLLEIVQKNKLYKSGHYHWNPTTRTLGFIDTNKLLAQRASSLVAKGSILEAYNSNKVVSDYVIGLGQEGIILGGFLAREKGIPFTSIPYISRKADHSKQETELRLNGSKKITIVTDVIFSASSIKPKLRVRKF
jgi:predicted MPP superfamily phosphohydrolase